MCVAKKSLCVPMQNGRYFVYTLVELDHFMASELPLSMVLNIDLWLK